MRIKSFFKSVLIDVIKTYFKTSIIAIVVVIQLWIVREYTQIKRQLSQRKIENIFNATISLDRISASVTEELESCEVDGIYSGLFVVQDGVGKFIYLRGKWDFNIDKKQSNILSFPETIHSIQSEKDIKHVLNVCNDVITTMGSGSTKDTNEIYTLEYLKGNGYGEIDLNTYDFFVNNKYNNQIIDFGKHKQIQNLAFIMYLINNLNLSKHFSTKLSGLYIYPLQIQGLDFAFLTLSFVKSENSKCFSEDLEEQRKLFMRIQKIISSEIRL